jgi:F5/8 type C domain-containing protein
VPIFLSDRTGYSLRDLTRTTHQWRPIVLATAGYLGLTLIYSWPLIANLRHAVVHDPLDPILVAWILWWSTKAVPLTMGWWNAPIFFPAAGAFAFSEHLLGLAPIAAPIIALTGSPLLASNVTFLATYVLSGLGGYFLSYTLTRRHDAAFVSGLAFAFAPYRVSQLPHLQVLSAFWTPVCLAALHRYDREPKSRWAALAAAAWLMQALSTGYFLFFLFVLVALWFVWFALGKWSIRQWAGALVWFAAAAFLLAPELLGYKHILVDTYGFSRGAGDARFFGADIASVLQASPDVWLWGWLHAVRKPEGELFPGLTILVLMVCALWRRHRSIAADVAPAPRWLRRTLAATAALFGAASLLPVLLGSWHMSIAGVHLASISRADKPLTLALYCGIGWMATSPSLIAAWRSRSAPVFYAIAAGGMWALALGPSPEFLGHRAIYQAPYALLLLLPGFDGLRVPARFWMMAIVCLSVLAAFAVDRAQGRRRRIITLVAAVGVLLDGWPKPFPLRAEPEQHATPAGVSQRLDLPMADLQNAAALYQQTRDGVPSYNGFSGYEAPHQPAMRELLDAGDARILEAMTRRGSLGVVIDHAADGDGIARRLVSGYPGAVVVESHPDWSSYRLPASGGGDLLPDVAGQPVPIKAAVAAPSKNDARFAIDGDPGSRWMAGPQRQPAELSVELGQSSFVHQVVIDLGRFFGDFPARLQIDVSSDGKTWGSVWSGDTALQAYYGAVRHPKEVPLVFQIDRSGVRFIRLRQTGVRKAEWSIAELSVLR